MALERAWLTQAEPRAEVLEESDRLKSVILSSVSHELRTPLSTIKAAVSADLSLKDVTDGYWEAPNLLARVNNHACNPETQKRLWDVIAQLANETDNDPAFRSMESAT